MKTKKRFIYQLERVQYLASGVGILEGRRSGVGFELTVGGERSSERRVFGTGEAELLSDLEAESLLSLGGGGDGLLRGVSIKPVLQ